MGAYAWALSWVFDLSAWMREGVFALSDMAGPVTTWVQTVVRIARTIGNALDPKQAAEMVNGVADILNAAANVTDEMNKAGSKLLKMGASAWAMSWLFDVAAWMREGVFALSDMAGPVTTWVQTVVRIARTIGNSLDPKQAASMGQGVAEVLKACGAVTEQIVSAKNQLKGIKQSEGFWKFSVSVVSRIYAGVRSEEHTC